MVKAGGAGYMCSYPAISVFADLNRTRPYVYRGEAVVAQPSCASKFLKGKMRDEWGFDGFVESDCGAVQEVQETHHFVKTPAEAAAAALKWGHTDIDCGNYYNLSLQVRFEPNGPVGVCGLCCGGPTGGGWFVPQAALDANLTSIEDVEVSLGRRFAALLKLGLLDPEEDQPYARIPADALGWGALRARGALGRGHLAAHSPRGSAV
jgi:beta-glucosidase-like glycosyl hydrolase